MVDKQDIITAVKNLQLFLKVEELQGATVRLNTNGTPFCFVGGFNMVFQLQHNSTNWAFRVSHAPVGENNNRYKALSNYLSKSRFPYFTDFIYDEKGILVKGELVDTIRMRWLEGQLLKEYLEVNLQNKNTLLKLSEDFVEMTRALRGKKISHGDLQEGNILIEKSGDIRLVDYDSVCIPEIEGQKDLVTGLKGYQHPSRFKSIKASLKADYFSELIIYLSIVGLAEEPALWSKYQVKDTQYLLFSETDFEDLESSSIYNDLSGKSQLIDKLLFVLQKYLQEKDYLKLEPFDQYFKPPSVDYFKASREAIIAGMESILTWKVEGADTITISEGIGQVKETGAISVNPVSARIYKLSASNKFGKQEQEVYISTFPTPVLETLKIPIPYFTNRLNLNNVNISAPKIDISIKTTLFQNERPTFTAPSTQLKTITPVYKPKKEQLNLSTIYESIRRKLSGH